MPGCEPKELLLWSIFTRVWGQDKYEFGRLAQWLERLLHTQEVTGSSPVLPRAEVAEWQTRYVQGVVSVTDVWVQLPPSAPCAPVAQWIERSLSLIHI